jgi:hypothetical protein
MCFYVFIVLMAIYCFNSIAGYLLFWRIYWFDVCGQIGCRREGKPDGEGHLHRYFQVPSPPPHNTFPIFMHAMGGGSLAQQETGQPKLKH